MSVPRRSWPKPHLHRRLDRDDSGVPAHEQSILGFAVTVLLLSSHMRVSLQRPLMFRDRLAAANGRSHRPRGPRSDEITLPHARPATWRPLRASSRVMRWSNTSSRTGDVPQSRGGRADRQAVRSMPSRPDRSAHFNACDLSTPDSNVVFVQLHDRLRRSNAGPGPDSEHLAIIEIW